MNLPELIEQFRSEDKCRAYLEDLRWPDGVRCPRCGNDSIVADREAPSVGVQRGYVPLPVLGHGRDGLPRLPSAALEVVPRDLPGRREPSKGISAKQLQRTLGVSYKTAWYLGHRIRSAMEDDAPVPLEGIVEVDETWIGGVHRKTAKDRSAAREEDARARALSPAMAKLRLDHARMGQGRETKASYRGFVKDVVGDDAEYIFTDSDYILGRHDDWNTKHRKVDHSTDEWVRGIVHTNTIEGVWSLFKRSVVGTYHQMSAKHLPAYLDEMAFRFNNRDNAYLFRDTLLRIIEGDPLRHEPGRV